MPANVDTMMYVGKEPWHGLGTKLENVATAEEAIKAAGLDWEVDMAKVYTQTAEYRTLRQHYKANYQTTMDDKQRIEALTKMLNSLDEVPGKRVATRRGPVASNQIRYFGVFSEQFTPLQNRGSFDFMDALVGAGEAIYHTAGSVKGGSRIWVLAKLPDDLRISDTEVMQKYLLLANSHDGSMAVTIKPTAVRVVCSNTMQMALGQQTDRIFRTIHTGDVMGRVNQAREALGLQEAYFAMLMRGIEAMANERFQLDRTEEFLVQLFGQEENPQDIHARTRNQMDRVGSLFLTGIGVEGRTNWDMMNAVTQWVDHERGGKTLQAKDPVAARDARLDNAWFGGGKTIKQTAWDLLVPAGSVN